jgi:cytochrome b involved in lipid metabolism
MVAQAKPVTPTEATDRSRYYTPYEISLHSSPDDCWVSFLGGVYNMTKVVKDNEGPLVQPIIRNAGQDISHWFDKETGEIKKHIDPITNLERPHCPEGRVLHVAPNEPTSMWDTSIGTPWWKDKNIQVGKVSKRTQVIRVKNVLTSQEHKLEVPSEEIVREIRDRYLDYNWHASSYTWKVMMEGEDGEYLFNILDLDKNLEDNGVVDDTEEFEAYGIPDDYYIPVIHLYYKDDLTVA